MAETAELRERRMAVIRFLDGVIRWVSQVLEQRLLVRGEAPGVGGVLISPERLELWRDRESRLNRFLAELRDMRARLLAGPVPERWTTDRTVRGTILITPGPKRLLSQVTDYYSHYTDETRRSATDMEALLNASFFEALGAPHRIQRMTPTGINIVVPNPMRPDEFFRLPSMESRRGLIIEVMRDEWGNHFYVLHGRRHYLVGAP